MLGKNHFKSLIINIFTTTQADIHIVQDILCALSVTKYCWTSKKYLTDKQLSGLNYWTF